MNNRVGFVAQFLLLLGDWLLPGVILADDGTDRLLSLDPSVVVVGTVRQPPLAGMLPREHAARLAAANQADRAAWNAVSSREQWERYRSVRLEKLVASLGTFPNPPHKPHVQITARHTGDGYEVANLIVETRPGLFMTANLYRPAKTTASMPGVLLVHSHQQPKHVGWRQDMAMTWARAGCWVIVPDLVGHGERKQHPFAEPNPHDYHFRYDGGIQFHVIGDSLMGWFVWDLRRALDVLLDQPNIDAKRILAISEPAGGGDVAAVTAALDPRITVAMVNNFGGPQPETPYPLPPDAESSFEYSGRGSWESTRNLRRSISDGFLPWMIVASIAPRRLIYYHEFYWDRDHDPVWSRLRKIWGWYGADDHLVGLEGRGFVVGNEPHNTHWLAESRELLYPTLERWLAIPNPGREYDRRRPVADLFCLTSEAQAAARPAHQLAAELGRQRGEVARAKLAQLDPAARRQSLQRTWEALLGRVAPVTPRLGRTPSTSETLGTVRVERLHLATEPGIVVPTLLLIPQSRSPAVVVCLAQQGKHEFLKHRAAEIAAKLQQGTAVCLPDLRGTGESSLGDARDRRSGSTSLAAGEWMLGDSILAGRLRDLRTLLAYLRTRDDLDGRNIELWGDSFTPPNDPSVAWQVPYTASQRPAHSEPLGGLLALLGGLFEDDVRAVTVRGCLVSYQSLLASPFAYVPLDAVVPGAIPAGDLPGLVTGLTTRRLQIDAAVDGHNHPVDATELARLYPSRTK